MSIFKAYDIRGIYGTELTEETAYRLGRAFVCFLKCGTVAVGRDMRKSSPAVEAELVRGLSDQGADVVRIGMATTPMLYFAVGKFGYDAGINVTASHNPGRYNGFKLTREGAVPMSGETGIYDLRDMVEKGEFPEPPEKGKVADRADVLKEYISNILGFVDASGLKRYRIVADTGNGMAGMVIPPLMKKIPCELTHIFPELDGDFPNHEANPLKTETLEWLRAEVRKRKADLGVAFDGDSDRIGFVDEKGDVVPADLFIALIAKEVLSKNPGSKILHDLRSSKAVAEAVKEAGGIPVETRVGHSYIKEHMRKENAAFAGELSAHYYLRDNYFIESPYIVMLLLLKLMSETGRTVSELIRPLKKYHGSGEINFEVRDKEAAMNAVRAAFPDAERVYALDGLSIECRDWRLNLRPSNTEPLLRLNMEADTSGKLKEVREKVVGMLREQAGASRT